MPRFHGLHGGVVIDEIPPELVVVVQLLDDHVAKVNLTRKIARRPLVLVHHADAQIAGVAVGVPKTDDVEPRVKGRQDDEREHDDDRRRCFQNAKEIAFENAQHVFQARPSFYS